MVSNSNRIKVFLYLRRLIKPLCASNILNEYSKSETSYIAQHLLKALENREMKILVINIHSSGQHHSLVSICLHHTKKKSAPLQSTRHPKKRPQGSKAGVRNAIWSSPPRQLCLWFFFTKTQNVYYVNNSNNMTHFEGQKRNVHYRKDMTGQTHMLLVGFLWPTWTISENEACMWPSPELWVDHLQFDISCWYMQHSSTMSAHTIKQ